MTSMAGSAAVPLAHSVTGAGPLVVLVHGITEDHRSFDPLLPLLRPHYRLLTVDLRGHGESPAADSYRLDEMAEDIAAVVAQIGGTGGRADDGGGASQNGGDASSADHQPDQSAPMVVGHSLGGAVAAVYGARFPVRAVVNIDQSLDLASMQAQVKSVEPMLRGDAFPAVISGMFQQMAGRLPPAEQQRINAIRRPVQQVVLGVWAPLLELDATELAATVDATVTPAAPYPYLQVQGTSAGPGYPSWLRQRIPGAKVDEWEGIGHYPHLCEPERFVALLRAFDPAT